VPFRDADITSLVQFERAVCVHRECSAMAKLPQNRRATRTPPDRVLSAGHARTVATGGGVATEDAAAAVGAEVGASGVGSCDAVVGARGTQAAATTARTVRIATSRCMPVPAPATVGRP
jgi:hypothetical protein